MANADEEAAAAHEPRHGHLDGKRADGSRMPAEDITIAPIPVLPHGHCPTWANDQWRGNLATLHAYVARFGRLPAKTTKVNGAGLGKWMQRQRGDQRAGHLDQELAAALELVPGWEWARRTGTHPDDDLWERNRQELLTQIAAHGWDSIDSVTTTDHSRFLWDWVRRQRLDHMNGDLSDLRRVLCEAVPGWEWRTTPSRAYATSGRVDQVRGQ